MKYLDIIIEAWSALRAHTFRSFLTILGIVIGVFAVSMMLAVGQGLRSYMELMLQNIDNGDITISSSMARLTETDRQWLAQQLYTKHIIASVQTSTTVRSSDGKSFNPSVQFIHATEGAMDAVTVVSGRVLSWNDEPAPAREVVVDVQFAKTYKEAVGSGVYEQQLIFNGQEYVVVGVVTVPGSFSFGDGSVYMPYVFAQSSFKKAGYDKFAVLLRDPERYKAVMQHITTMLDTVYGTQDGSSRFSIYSVRDFAQGENKIIFYFNLFLGVIGGISLLVGGIGTMNMMLTTVSERTKEIGVRKAIGARNSDVITQILLESVMLTVAGGIIGVLFTTVLTFVVNKLLNTFASGSGFDFTLVVNPFVVAISVAVSVLVGVVFGLYPAKQASKLPVSEALRLD